MMAAKPFSCVMSRRVDSSSPRTNMALFRVSIGIEVQRMQEADKGLELESVAFPKKQMNNPRSFYHVSYVTLNIPIYPYITL